MAPFGISAQPHAGRQSPNRQSVQRHHWTGPWPGTAITNTTIAPRMPPRHFHQRCAHCVWRFRSEPQRQCDAHSIRRRRRPGQLEHEPACQQELRHRPTRGRRLRQQFWRGRRTRWPGWRRSRPRRAAERRPWPRRYGRQRRSPGSTRKCRGSTRSHFQRWDTTSSITQVSAAHDEGTLSSARFWAPPPQSPAGSSARPARIAASICKRPSVSKWKDLQVNIRNA